MPAWNHCVVEFSSGTREAASFIAYLTDPNPTPVQWDIQYYAWDHVTHAGGSHSDLCHYFQTLLNAGVRPDADGSPAEVAEFQRLAALAGSVGGVRWDLVSEAIRAFDRGS